MKKFTKIALISSGVLAVIGIAFMISGVAMGATFKQVAGSFRFYNDTFFDRMFYEDDYWDTRGWMKGNAEDHEFQAGSINNLDIDFDRGELTIARTDGDTIVVTTYNERDRVQVSGDTLKIESRGKRNLDNDIQVMIPSDKSFDKVKLDIDAGNTDVDTLNANGLEVDLDAGKVNFNDRIKVRDAKMDVDAGMIDVAYLDADRVEIDCDAGEVNVVLAGKQEDYQAALDCNLGSLEVGGEENSGFEQKRNWGQSNAPRKLKADCDAGKLQVDFEEEF